MNKDTVGTILGLITAAATGVGDYFVHLGPDGLDYTQPTFWIEMVIAILAGIKGYLYGKPVKPAPAPESNG